MRGRSPAQTYALLFGITLVGAGIVGFFYSADFGDPGHVDGVLGILDVNGWHNVVHIATGLIGLAVAGFIAGDGHTLLSIVPVNTEDNLLHLLIGIAGLGAGLGTPAVPAPTT